MDNGMSGIEISGCRGFCAVKLSCRHDVLYLFNLIKPDVRGHGRMDYKKRGSQRGRGK